MHPPYHMVSHYDPPEWNATRIGRELLEISRLLGLKPLRDGIQSPQTHVSWYDLENHAEVRRRTDRSPKGTEWHQDGDLKAGADMDHALLLWASNTPTEFRTPDGHIWQPAPRQVVLVRNLACQHRRPPNAPRVRWLFRQRVERGVW